MLEGLEISVLNSNDFLKDNFDFRLDAEYFIKSNLKQLETLTKVGYKKVSEFGYVTDGIHTAIDYCEDSNVNLFSATTPRENYFDLSRKAYISKKAHEQNPRTALKENDIIISTVGTIGNCAVVNKSILPANSDRHVGIIRLENDEFYPRYISTFLLSKFGRFQTWRESTGNVQLNLFLYRIRTLKVANLSKQFQSIIEEKILLSDEKRQQSKHLYTQAENLLLQEIGLQDFTPNAEAVNIKNFKDSFGTSGRLDAEYYQKKYEEVVAKIVTQKHSSLINIVDISKSIEPGSNHYADEKGLPFYRVSDYSKFGLSQPDKELTNSFIADNKDLIEKLKPQKGTILFSKDGSLGTAYLLRDDLDGITSGAILHLQVKNTKEVIPEYLTLALNSILVQMQAERDAGGSIILHWRKEEIEQVVVPIIDYKKQEQIAQLVAESFRLKQESENLLEVAKQAVEIAIEQNEESAINFIELGS